MKKITYAFLLFCCITSQTQAQTAAPLVNVAPVQLQWKLQVPAAIYASPVTDGNLVYAGALDGNFYAVDIKTGQKSWAFKTGGEIRSTALLFDDRIYFSSADGRVYCIDKKGQPVWEFTASDRKYDFADYHQSSPVEYEGTIYVGMGDGCMYAINASKGKLKWKYQTEGPVHTTAAVDEERVYFGSFDGNVYAVSNGNGKLRWKYKTAGHTYFPKGEVQGDPVLINNIVVVGARDYQVYALDKEKGTLVWNKTYDKGWVLSNTVNDSLLYMAGADQRMLTAVNSEGKEKWKRTMELLVFGKTATDEEVLYVGTSIGKLHAIDAKSGRDLWVYPTDGYTAHHLEYFNADDSYRDDLKSIVTTNEQFLQAQEKLGGIFSTPLVYTSYVLFSTTDGALYCLRVKF